MRIPLALTCLLALAILAAPAAAAPPEGFDARVEAAMRSRDVPGMAIAIVEDGRIVHAKGYGVRRLGGSEPVDADTIFPTGSTGKAVTAAALAILVDDRKLGWDDRVIDHLPEFRMSDAWVTREMTVRDLLVHRSGLGLGAGDLLFIPRTSRSRADIVRALRHIEPATSFRSGYAYDNILYIVAGELVEAVSGQSWESFVEQRIFAPLGMATAVSREDRRFATANRAQPHARLHPQLRGLGEQQLLPEREGLGQVGAPAGGLSWSANDFARWLQVQLALGARPDGDGRLWSEATAREMWTPQVPVPVRQYPAPIDALTPQFSSYALGWNVQDYRGVRTVQHGGAVFGVLAFVVLVPERNLGIALQINAEDVDVIRGLGQELLDHYLGFEHKDWVAAFGQWNQARLQGGLAALEAAGDARRNTTSRPSLPPAGYAGTYADPWYGPMTIATRGRDLRIDFTRTPGMTGTLRHWQYDTFRADWDDASIEPAFVTFALDADGRVARITMKAVSPLADFSYDYHDLRFVPQAATE
ncbi:serine hydrolase [Luteimonas sp. M1R5S18]|jgi:CubicO group peptidase (beta-lactamase class C family)|uniref:Serine hydrolase n=1 Tax=Luteimonas rhizosphaericola TaxID=3042024 RepID=A0ABT6JIS0_9GAMM|nr:serine hydrolase [Luteimonas rhizosphaericola]MDH5830570.1 serine hydrolase [Luteimonas rhizosphaericola]